MTVVWGVTHTERCAALPQGPPRSGVSAEETDSVRLLVQALRDEHLGAVLAKVGFFCILLSISACVWPWCL